jgi:hypothetical protein
VSDEEHVAYLGSYIRLDAGVDISAVTVTKDAAVLGENTDFIVKKGGIYIPANAGLANGDAILVSYTHADSRTVEAILNFGKEYRFSFDGFNQAFDDNPVVRT